MRLCQGKHSITELRLEGQSRCPTWTELTEMSFSRSERCQSSISADTLSAGVLVENAIKHSA